MEVISIGSSSSGNSYIIKAAGEKLLLDLGLSAKKILIALETNDISKEEISAILITHEHIDHVRSIRKMSTECSNADFYVSRGTYENCKYFDCTSEDKIHYVNAGEDFTIGKLEIRAFSLSHDAAEPIGFSFIEDGKKLSVVTDTGYISDEIFDEIKTSDSLVLEANHEEDLLMMGEYPYHVKMRIKSNHGHLSNEATAKVIADILDRRKVNQELSIMLAHLSEKNNAPYYARTAIESILKERGYERDRDYFLSIAAKEGFTAL